MAEATERLRGRKGVTAQQAQTAREAAWQECIEGEVRHRSKRSRDPAEVQKALFMLGRAKG